MRWRKLGIVWAPPGAKSWARSHASLPTPVVIDADVIRVFVTCLDDLGRGRPTWVDVSAHCPTRVLATSDAPLLDIGRPGTFDDNGLMVTSVLRLESNVYALLYAGFELCTHVRYRIFTGAALSTDFGRTFKRISECRILDRSNDELYFRCGAFMLRTGDTFRLWYIAGSEWIDLGDGKPLPVYHLRYQESPDPFSWHATGKVSMDIADPDEHGFGRPWVVQKEDDDTKLKLFYSVRRISLGAYRLGYAEGTTGLDWHRKDAQLGLDVTPGSFDGGAIMYCAVVTVHGQTYCFYNGDNFGRNGFAVAALES
jgi:hypothetical protein